ncbi:putative Uncharacterized HTH-type transcriptional regulator R00410 [Candidatus Xenohaliotis californiensis]|uniref:Uncharacterized HTH-type transcriptional regulator R00410 n=1 Tax=Candidatus Xenohaliotis californiensis TaxID=84677 RepID=A0ABM9N7Z7_9RICK|nr:putative Uncharacterized HTH-type transcriptional regulator R00410 [Candidatus Xenohaliotis californiensis]
MPHPIDLHAGKQLRTIRLVRNLTQEDLGKKVNITTQQIQKYEKGQNRISASRLYEFSVVLNVSIDYFFKNITDEPQLKDDILTHAIQNDDLKSPSMAMFSENSESFINALNVNPIENKVAGRLLHSFFSIKEHHIKEKILQLVKALAKETNS